MRTDQTPYSYKGTEWISYDDVTSLSAKLNIVSARSLGGAFFWSIDQDDYGKFNIDDEQNFVFIVINVLYNFILS